MTACWLGARVLDSRSEVRGFGSPHNLWEFLQPKFDAECGLRYNYYESITKNPQLILFRRLSPKIISKHNNSTDPTRAERAMCTWPGQRLKFQYVTNLNVMLNLSQHKSMFRIPNFSIWHSSTKDPAWSVGIGESCLAVPIFYHCLLVRR